MERESSAKEDTVGGTGKQSRIIMSDSDMYPIEQEILQDESSHSKLEGKLSKGELMEELAEINKGGDIVCDDDELMMEDNVVEHASDDEEGYDEDYNMAL